jgi:hypothetical protein
MDVEHWKHSKLIATKTEFSNNLFTSHDTFVMSAKYNGLWSIYIYLDNQSAISFHVSPPTPIFSPRLENLLINLHISIVFRATFEHNNLLTSSARFNKISSACMLEKHVKLCRICTDFPQIVSLWDSVNIHNCAGCISWFYTQKTLERIINI